MLNREPIFVNGFSRGGTTILTNLLASHPDVCLIGETHHVFKGTSITDSRWDVLRKVLCYDTPIIMTQRQDFFSPRLIQPRKPLSDWAKKRVDAVFYREKLRSLHPLLNRFKGAGAEYTPAEIEASRLLAKNIDGMIYANDVWAEMYPDASFFGLVRNGLAICEGHVRRGRSATAIGRRYQLLVDKMLDDGDRLPRYCLVRFESLLAAPWQTLQTVCAHVGLRVKDITRFAHKHAASWTPTGTIGCVAPANGMSFGCNRMTWSPTSIATSTAIRSDACRRPTAMRFSSRPVSAMERLGYSVSLPDDDATEDAAEPCILPFPRPSRLPCPPPVLHGRLDGGAVAQDRSSLN